MAKKKQNKPQEIKRSPKMEVGVGYYHGWTDPWANLWTCEDCKVMNTGDRCTACNKEKV